MAPVSERNVLSLFSSAGIGELGIKASGFNILLSNELLKNRCDLYKENFPETQVICGDVWKKSNEIVDTWKSFEVGSPFLIYATPPCQGMSFNSVGKRLKEIREGRRPKDDVRNQLIIPTIKIIKELRPEWILLENVKEMANTIIPLPNGTYKNIIDFIKDELKEEYVGHEEIVNCADYGIAQTRVRLITIFSRTTAGKKYFKKYGTFMPQKTHSESGDDGNPQWIKLRDVIGNLPSLSSEIAKNYDPHIPWHIVPVMKADKFWWVQNTPENETAYNNQCVECGYKDNPRHGMYFKDGRHISKKDTPIYCERCGALLPRPTMIDKNTGKRRMIKGFDSAYRRMSWDTPSPTLTQLFQSEASDKKIHPSQNRTLSIYEGMLIQTISDYEFKFSIKGNPITMNTCCQVIGESVPPRLIERICHHIVYIEEGGEDGQK